MRKISDLCMVLHMRIWSNLTNSKSDFNGHQIDVVNQFKWHFFIFYPIQLHHDECTHEQRKRICKKTLVVLINWKLIHLLSTSASITQSPNHQIWRDTQWITKITVEMSNFTSQIVNFDCQNPRFTSQLAPWHFNKNWMTANALNHLWELCKKRNKDIIRLLSR